MDSSGDEDKAREALRGVIDPEVGINIVDLGLVYAIEIDARSVVVTMTMTTPACPLGGLIQERAEQAILQVLPGHKVDVELVWDPPWTPERMSSAAKQMLGFGD